MENTYNFEPKTLLVDGKSYKYVDLPGICGDKLEKLPVVLRLLLENIARNANQEEKVDSTRAILKWLDSGSSEAEIAFQPSRVLMHDTTSTPALVDIAAMRNTLNEAGVNPSVLNPLLPVDVSVDHSLAVEAFATKNAATINLQHEIRRNSERYKFLRWASSSLKGVRINPPGTGIMHTINLEQLATVVTTENRNGDTWAIPDMMIGTDSHTPMINGIGVLGWGVGGLEAQTAMFGMPTMLRIPDVIGVKLTGKLPTTSLSTDLALTVTSKLRELGVTGEFVEFYGDGVSNLSVGDRAVVANMAPEYGATTGFFPIDEKTLAYLRSTGRTEASIKLVETYSKAVGIWFDSKNEPKYSKSITIDLSKIKTHIAGPRRPQDLLTYNLASKALGEVEFKPTRTLRNIPPYPVAFAAISSCTNTSDPALLIAAGLVARKAKTLGIKPPSWVKTSLAPGSPAAATYLSRSGLLKDLEDIGFGIVGYGCTTCIGNSGPLTAEISEAQSLGASKGVAIVSGNRNFPGRIHPELELSFIMSPALVIAFGLAGNAEINLEIDPVQTNQKGEKVYLKDIWPTREEIESFLSTSQDPSDYKQEFVKATANPLWGELEAPSNALFPWNEKSTILRRPPFASLSEGSQLGQYTAFPLLIVGDDVTTDHISPASAIPKNSLVADFLVAKGDDRNDLNVFASRRGNWEVMLRAAFHSKTLTNHLKEDLPVAHTLHVPSNTVMPIWDAAHKYQQENNSVVLVAGERYGMGSSRDWAAKGQRLLGIKAVLAVSFERIHRSNLIGMGILPLKMLNGASPQTLKIQPGDKIEINASPEKISPRCEIAVNLIRANGNSEKIAAIAAIETQLEVDLLKDGGVIPSILRKTISNSQN